MDIYIIIRQEKYGTIEFPAGKRCLFLKKIKIKDNANVVPVKRNSQR